MYKSKNFIIFLLSIITLLSCEEDFNPFGEEKKIHILNCVLKGNQKLQSAYLAESYFVDDFNPYLDTNNHTIDNSFIRVWFNDSVKVFSDSIAKSETTNFDITTYVHNDFSLLPDTEYQIEASFKNGRKMHGTTKTPKKVLFSSESDKIIPPIAKSYVRVKWTSIDEQLYTASRFAFVYLKKEGATQVRYVKGIPQAYINNEGELLPFSPEPSYSSGITVDMSAFDKSLEEISVGDPNKHNYTILGFILEILIYDRNLTSYYASKAELGDGFSITVNETDYSNIVGGRGVFGSFIKQNYSLKFTHDYIRSFGYLPGLSD